jgi:hypothetical protein
LAGPPGFRKQITVKKLAKTVLRHIETLEILPQIAQIFTDSSFISVQTPAVQSLPVGLAAPVQVSVKSVAKKIFAE